jgi:hypothetical protein
MKFWIISCQAGTQGSRMEKNSIESNWIVCKIIGHSNGCVYFLPVGLHGVSVTIFYQLYYVLLQTQDNLFFGIFFPSGFVDHRYLIFYLILVYKFSTSAKNSNFQTYNLGSTHCTSEKFSPIWREQQSGRQSMAAGSTVWGSRVFKSSFGYCSKSLLLAVSTVQTFFLCRPVCHSWVLMSWRSGKNSSANNGTNF